MQEAPIIDLPSWVVVTEIGWFLEPVIEAHPVAKILIKRMANNPKRFIFNLNFIINKEYRN
jgi:hypothetical protein